MANEAFSLEVPTRIYLDLAYQLRRSGDMRTPDEIVGLALKSWLAAHCGARSGRGYQWKQLFLPDGSDLRMRYRGAWYYAKVEGDLSPREWGLLVTGTVRNPWRDVWIRRGITESWTRAAVWRSQSGSARIDPHTERRRHARRRTD